jgi:hypothetical protein
MCGLVISFDSFIKQEKPELSNFILLLLPLFYITRVSFVDRVYLIFLLLPLYKYIYLLV